MKTCLTDLFTATYPKLSAGKGFEKIGVQAIEPFFIDTATIRDSSVFTGSLTGLYLTGFSEAFAGQNVKVFVNPESRRAIVKLRSPKLTLSGKFDAVANILKSVLPFYSGPASRVDGNFEAVIGTYFLVESHLGRKFRNCFTVLLFFFFSQTSL
jgi:hypothetical protein